jgi:hypothetical protein
MKKFGVRIPVTGYVYLEVMAEDEEEAMEKAWETEATLEDVAEWETIEQVCKGNVCYAVENKMYAEELENDPT